MPEHIVEHCLTLNRTWRRSSLIPGEFTTVMEARKAVLMSQAKAPEQFQVRNQVTGGTWPVVDKKGTNGKT